MVAYQITELANVCRGNKTAGYQIVLEDVGNPLGVLFVGFLTANRLDVFRMGQDDIASRL